MYTYLVDYRKVILRSPTGEVKTLRGDTVMMFAADHQDFQLNPCKGKSIDARISDLIESYYWKVGV